MKMDKATQAEFASFVGISEARASQLASDGVLIAGGTLRDWTRAYCERLRGQAAGRASDNDPMLTDERARLVRAKREQAEIQLAEQRGEVIRVDAVRTQLANRLAATRDGLLQIPARVSAVLAAETSSEVVFTTLSDELCKALEGLTGSLESNTALGQGASAS
ncbi:hypothetical protein [Ottowia oryzae]|nr:hypothetical protein [Ottowia oryzae]